MAADAFAFHRHEQMLGGDLHYAVAALPGDAGSLSVGADTSMHVSLSRWGHGLSASIALTPQQARALAAELVAAADAVDLHGEDEGMPGA